MGAGRRFRARSQRSVDLEQMIKRGCAKSYTHVCPGNVLNNLQSHHAIQKRDSMTGISGLGQQDAREFFQFVCVSLQRLEHLCESKTSKRTNDLTSLNNAISGTTRVTRTCTLCRTARNMEYIWSILTEYISRDCKELSDCFNHITKKQTLYEKNTVFCEKCKQKTKTSDHSQAISAIDMLVVHLNLSTQRRTGTYKLQKDSCYSEYHFPYAVLTGYQTVQEGCVRANFRSDAPWPFNIFWSLFMLHSKWGRPMVSLQ